MRLKLSNVFNIFFRFHFHYQTCESVCYAFYMSYCSQLYSSCPFCAFFLRLLFATKTPITRAVPEVRGNGLILLIILCDSNKLFIL